VGGPAQDARRVREYGRRFTAFCGSWLGGYEVLHTQGHRLPIRRPGAAIHGPGALLVGDAAALVNPLDGEGIYYAIRSAQLAVPFILDALVAPGRPDFAAYQRAVDGELATDLESAWRLM